VLLCLLYGNWCAVTATSFGQTIGLPAIVDFTQANAANDDGGQTVTGFQIKAPLPNGTLTKASVAVVADDVCGDGDCTYTPLISECAGGGTDNIVYRAESTEGDFSSEETVTITISAFNCAVAADFPQAISAGTGAIDFSSVGVTDSALQVKITTLPANGVISVTAGGAAAVTSTKYDRDALTYTANPSECAAGVTDTFTYKSVTSSDD